MKIEKKNWPLKRQMAASFRIGTSCSLVIGFVYLTMWLTNLNPPFQRMWQDIGGGFLWAAAFVIWITSPDWDGAPVDALDFIVMAFCLIPAMVGFFTGILVGIAIEMSTGILWGIAAAIVAAVVVLTVIIIVWLVFRIRDLFKVKKEILSKFFRFLTVAKLIPAHNNAE